MTLCLLSQIEVLGVSLPWKDVFSKEGHGARLYELAQKFRKETNPFLSALDTNPFAASLSNETVPQTVQTDASANWLDLLTGESEPSESISQPVRENVMSGGGDLLAFLDNNVTGNKDAEADSMFSTSKDGRASDGGAQKYINCLKSLVGPNMVC